MAFLGLGLTKGGATLGGILVKKLAITAGAAVAAGLFIAAEKSLRNNPTSGFGHGSRETEKSAQDEYSESDESQDRDLENDDQREDSGSEEDEYTENEDSQSDESESDESESDDSRYDTDDDEDEESKFNDDETTEENSEEYNTTVGTYNAVNRANPQRYSQVWVTEIDHPLPVSVFNRMTRRVPNWQSMGDLPVIQISGIVHRNMRSTANSEVSINFRADLERTVNQSIAEAFKLIFNDQHTTTIQVRRELTEIPFPRGFTLRRELKVLHRRQRRLIRHLYNCSIITLSEMEDLLSYIGFLARNGRDRDFIRKYPKGMKIPRNYEDMFNERRRN